MMWETERDSTGGRDENTGVIISGKQAMTTDGFEHRDGSWYVATDVPSDLLIQVGDVRFHVHKYPLLSRSAKMNDILYKSKDTEINKVEFQDLPGGPEAFELVAKFCYGIPIDLTASNISGLRCASEYLEMTEDLDEGNLIFKTEAFLSYVVLASWRDSIVVLKSCEHLSPWAENLQIVRRCCESIAWKACANPQGIRWAYTAKITGTSSTKWIDTKDCSQQVPSDWWFEDVSILRIDHFVRVMTAIKVKATKLDLLGTAIMYYGAKWVPGLSNEVSGEDGGKSKEIDSNWKGGLHLIVPGFKEDQHSIELREQKMIIESLISIIPPHKDTVSCGFLLRLLRMANAMKVAPALITELEKRVGMQLEQASLADLLIPSCHNSETIYDVDAVQRILEHFLVQEQMESSSPGRRTVTPRIGGSNARARVARLIDSCLTEVSKDRNLSPTKFQVLAEALPESARSCDDGLYRAIDSYLKAHPMMSEHERKRLCRVMDCQKLSIDACMHAAQNERLPLRVVVQVLFSGQVKISNAIANNSFKGGETYYSPVMPSRKALLEGTQPSFQDSWATAKDINMLKFELESVKAKYLELQNDIEVLQRQFEKTLKPKQHLSAWSNGWKKLNQLTRMARNETQEVTTSVEQTRKLPRRWRNSIS